jgi:methylglutaconyl-CoA hydratase
MNLELDIDDLGIAHLRLNRPERHNAFDEDLIAAIQTAVKKLGADKWVRAILLSGNGPSFCAGGDLGWMKRAAEYTKAENEMDALRLADLFYALKTAPKPTVALVHGAVMGGGIGLTACCDLAFAAENASFAFSEGKLGLIPATIAPYVLTAIGPRTASRFFLSAERFDAKQALAMGLVHGIVPDAEALGSYAVKFLQGTVLKCGPDAVAAAKKLIFDLEGRAITPKLARETANQIAAIRATEEAKEGLRAFFEKRPPAWHRRDGGR